MKYDFHFRNGTIVTIESKLTLQEINDFFAEESSKIWGVLGEDGEPQAIISIIDLVAIVPNPAPARVIDKDGDVWIEIDPGSDRWIMVREAIMSLARITEQYGPLKSETAR